MKREVRIIVFEDDDIEDDIPTAPAEFMAFWREKIDLIPQEFMDTANIDLVGDSRWESGYLEARISFTRLETDEEEAARLKKEEDRRKFIENQELCQLENLKAKYGV